MSEEKQKLVSEWAALIDDAHVALMALRMATIDTPALSIEGVIEKGLLLSKEYPTFDEMASLLNYVSLAELESKFNTINRDGYDDLFAVLWWKKLESERQPFRIRLEELMRSPSKTRNKHQSSDIQELQSQMLITSVLNDNGWTEQRFYPRTVKAAYTYVLNRLYSKDERRWERLRICPQCQGYFFRQLSKSGGRPRVYCTIECQNKHDQKMALTRQKKARQRKLK